MTPSWPSTGLPNVFLSGGNEEGPDRPEKTIVERVSAIADDLALSKPGGRDLTRDEIDELWGDPQHDGRP